jgi:glucose-1-phosphate thymidylyltransferase
MRAIIPIAGYAKRLRPITDYKPKALVEVAGKPVLEHIMSNLTQNGVNEVVLIVGHMKEMIIEWLEENFGEEFKLHFVEQKELLGLGHAIYMAKEFLDDDDVLVMLGDEIHSKNYSEMIKGCKDNKDIDAAIGIMIVQNPSHYGMLRMNAEGFVTLMVEKPKSFNGKLALAGVYYFKTGRKLKQALEAVVNQTFSGKEFQLTDALQQMVERKSRFVTFSVGEGYDCGRPDSLMKSNRRMLIGKHFIDSSAKIIDTEIIEPCHISTDAIVEGSIIGPFVSLGRGAFVKSSVLSDVIVESYSRVENQTISYSIISQRTSIELEQKDIDEISKVMEDSTSTQIE